MWHLTGFAVLLCAGCPAAVANLWDVTDRDIDRFGEMLLQHWLGSNPTTADASGSSRSSSSSSSKAAKTAAAPPGRDCKGHQGGVAGVVNDSREACRLQWLIGAAPVCYGVPTRVLPVTQVMRSGCDML
jgi:separase